VIHPTPQARGPASACGKANIVHHRRTLFAGLCTIFQRPEIIIITFGLARQHRVEGVVKIIVPMSVQGITTPLTRPQEPRIVAVALGDQHQAPPQFRFQRPDFQSQLRDERLRRIIYDGVQGIEAKTVKMIIAQPHKGVVAEKAAHIVAIGFVEIDRRAPRRGVTVLL